MTDASSIPPLSAVVSSTAVFVVVTIGSFIYANVDPLEVMAAEAKGCPVWCMAQLPFSAAHGLILATVTFGATWLAAVARARFRSQRRSQER